MFKKMNFNIDDLINNKEHILKKIFDDLQDLLSEQLKINGPITRYKQTLDKLQEITGIIIVAHICTKINKKFLLAPISDFFISSMEQILDSNDKTELNFASLSKKTIDYIFVNSYLYSILQEILKNSDKYEIVMGLDTSYIKNINITVITMSEYDLIIDFRIDDLLMTYRELDNTLSIH